MEVASSFISEIVSRHAGDKHGDQKKVERSLGDFHGEPQEHRLLRRGCRNALGEPKEKMKRDKNQDRDAGIGVYIGACHLVLGGCTFLLELRFHAFIPSGTRRLKKTSAAACQCRACCGRENKEGVVVAKGFCLLSNAILDCHGIVAVVRSVSYLVTIRIACPSRHELQSNLDL